MDNKPKRYLVTYADGNISTENATGILGVTKSKVKEGVTFMETEATPAKSDVLHFETLGVTSIELNDDEVEKLAKKEGVLAVEEDTEMHALKSESEVSEEQQYAELFMNGDEYMNGAQAEEPVEDHYAKGYNKALLDIFASVLNNTVARQQDTNGYAANPTLVPPVLRGPIGRLPIPFPIVPPVLLRQPYPWNITLVKAPAAWQRGITGAGIKVAILDTGIASHADLNIAGGISFIPGSTSYNDVHSHGTHCAGIVAAKNNSLGVVGVAPSASLYAVKVLGDNGSGMTSGIIAGMEWCIRNGIKVASMSLGSSSGPSTAYATAVRRCQDNGVTVVTASGNSYGTTFPWVCAPANSAMLGVPNASPIAVGAVNNLCVIGSFSSRGSSGSPWNTVSCVAPGVSINSTTPGGYGLKTGTSMACPHVAGLAALIIQRYPGITPATVKRRISTTCMDLGASGYDSAYGFGLINCDSATL